MPVQRKQIPLDQAKAGMVLSDALIDNQGNVLLAQDMTLTDATIAALRRHQIESVAIVSGMLSDDEFAARRKQYEERLARLFRKPTNDVEDATGILMQYVRYYRLGGEEQ